MKILRNKNGKILTGGGSVYGVTAAIDANITPANLRKGVEIMGVRGTYGDPTSQVRFIDYDGTVLHSFSREEFALLEAMPANPSHEGLTAQGWNWSLAEAKAYVAKYGFLDIGQMYITYDGATRAYVEFVETSFVIPCQATVSFTQEVAGDVVIDWDDGTVETVQDTGDVVRSHKYGSLGSFVISLKPSSGVLAAGGTLFASGPSAEMYPNFKIRRIELGAVTGLSVIAQGYDGGASITDITIPLGTALPSMPFGSVGWSSLVALVVPVCDSWAITEDTFYNCRSLLRISLPNVRLTLGIRSFTDSVLIETIALPETVTNIPSYFCATTLVRNLVIANGVRSIGSYCFGRSLFQSLVIPEGVTIVGEGLFGNPYGNPYAGRIRSISFPSTLTRLGARAFAGCVELDTILMKASTPPELTGAFGATVGAEGPMSPYYRILVPKGSLEAYRAATNWSEYAGRMVEID